MNKFWSLKTEEILQNFDVSVDEGLSCHTVKSSQKKYGKNRLRETKSRSTLAILVDQFESLIMVLLAVAALLSFIFGENMQGFAVIAVILVTAAIGFFTEIRAVRSMQALRQMSRVSANVRRGGEAMQIPAVELVPGDIVILDGGDIITADMRILEANKLQVDESALTGESVPVSKSTEALPEDTPVSDRKNSLFKGTAVTRGSGEGIVVSTGMDTELGKISELVEESEEEITPIEKRLNRLGNKLIWLTIGIAAVVSLIGISQDRDLFLMIETGIALAVAAIPEGLPIVATIALARGLSRMAKRNALINKLGSVETLGATNIIFTDKTGTLTENKMHVTEIVLKDAKVRVSGEKFSMDNENIDPESHKTLSEALKIGVLCNNASLSDSSDEDIGDPLETALLSAGDKASLSRKNLLEHMPEGREEAFDPDNKMMATFHHQDDEFYVAVKGAPESVLDVCENISTSDGIENMDQTERERWMEINQKMADNGLRVLAVAWRVASSAEENPYQNLNFTGLIGLLDPPRKAVKEAIAACHGAGIEVKMVTGDHPITARKVASAVELSKEDNVQVISGEDLKDFEKLTEDERRKFREVPIFARVSPEQKLDLISVHQENGAIVAMTGDGVNDAPALKKADIGIAMGRRGTQVAREAADMILKDDAFSSIVTAVGYGRVIFKNIRKFVLYLLSGNVGEVMAVGLASLVGLPLPLRPLQILFINLLLDVFPAMALGVGEGDPNVMQRHPRDPGEPVLAGKHWWLISGYGTLIAMCMMGALILAMDWLHLSADEAVTISFLTLGFTRLWHVFNMREVDSKLIRNEITKNPFVWGAILLCATMLIAAVYLPGLSDILGTHQPDASEWRLIVGMSLIPLLIGQGAQLFIRHFKT
ncbi:MAG: cation-transporting P-type ATPase [candidate division KSB1 bacterium]|jgi:Ca2+-transporting ATPase|nr:cation-transporting P-type ATPase [candidate division KSB1 bacterium]